MKFLKFILALLICSNVSAAELPPFKDGSTVCFLGNSITQAGKYLMVFQAYYASRYPESNVKFVNCGVSGDTASDMIARFDDDVMRYKPDYCFLMVGMNDMSAWLYRAGLEINESLENRRKACMDRYKTQVNELLKKITSQGIKPILMTPTIYDETAQLKSESTVGKSDALLQCAEFIKATGAKHKLPVVDHTQFMLDINREAQKSDPKYTIVGPDRVHPREVGHFIMAYRIASTLLPEGAKYVSSVTIDAKRKSVKQSVGCDVSIEPGGDLSFKLRSKSSPMAVIGKYKEALQYVPFTEDLNQEIIKVGGLKEGRYLLNIDAKCVDTLSSAELAAGVNLATNQLTPQYKQAAEVFKLCEKYHAEQSTLRYIAHVVYKWLANYKGEDNQESRMVFLNELIEKSKNNANIPRTINIYSKNIDREGEIEANINSLRSDIYKNSQPKEHSYTIEKLNEKQK